MKTRIIVALVTLCLFSSCIVKSLNPFYTKDTIHYDPSFTGNWKDSKNGEWIIESFKDNKDIDFEKDVKHFEINGEDVDVSIFNNAYTIEYIKNKQSVTNATIILVFITIGFRIPSK